MLRLVRSTFFALFFVSLGFVAASVTDGPSAHAQSAGKPDQPRSAPSLPATGGNTERAGAAVLKAAAAAPEIGTVVEEMKRKIEGMEKNLNQLVSEARATAARYVLWGTVTMVALMFISSVIGGTVVGLMMRRSKAG